MRFESIGFTVFALFYFVIEGNFPNTSPGGGAYIWRGDLTEGFCVTGLRDLYLEGLIHGGLIFGILRYLFYRENFAGWELRFRLFSWEVKS